jgi:hypothetical protein
MSVFSVTENYITTKKQSVIFFVNGVILLVNCKKGQNPISRPPHYGHTISDYKNKWRKERDWRKNLIKRKTELAIILLAKES